MWTLARRMSRGGGYDFLQLCFNTPDLGAFLRHLAELGVAPLHPPRPFEHTTFTTLLDPDGRHVRVMTPWQRESAPSAERGAAPDCSHSSV
jgi:hypothetical protein